MATALRAFVRHRVLALGTGSLLAIAVTRDQDTRRQQRAREGKGEGEGEGKGEGEGERWPAWSAEDVAERDGTEGRSAWVAVGRRIYDVTDYARLHPGGPHTILQAAGSVGAVEALWAQWPAHWSGNDQREGGTQLPGRFSVCPSAKVQEALATQCRQVGILEATGEEAGRDGREGHSEGRHVGESGTSARLMLADDVWHDEPARDAPSSPCALGSRDEKTDTNALLTLTRRPFQAEPRYVPGSFLTPARLFYVRNHGPVPPLASTERSVFTLQLSSNAPRDAGEQHALELDSQSQSQSHCQRQRQWQWTIAELEDPTRFAQHRVACTLQCTGNRCDELEKYSHGESHGELHGESDGGGGGGGGGKGDDGGVCAGTGGGAVHGVEEETQPPPVPAHTPVRTQFAGLTGSKGYISTAEWEGPLLADVLAAAHCPVPAILPAQGTEVVEAIEAVDESQWHVELEGLDGYRVSIPCAYMRTHPVVLATKMNGEHLPRDHGAPLRVVVMGAVGARSVKWCSHVHVRKTESKSPWQQHYYRRDGDSVGAIMDWPVTGLITSVNDGDAVTVSAEDKGQQGREGEEGKMAKTAGKSNSAVTVQLPLKGIAYSGP